MKSKTFSISFKPESGFSPHSIADPFIHVLCEISFKFFFLLECGSDQASGQMALYSAYNRCWPILLDWQINQFIDFAIKILHIFFSGTRSLNIGHKTIFVLVMSDGWEKKEKEMEMHYNAVDIVDWHWCVQYAREFELLRKRWKTCSSSGIETFSNKNIMQ